jgi:gliding motility-associated protein GldM
MGGGKETPRQKMIGLMYLVLMALLAMNVSKQIINAFVTLNNNMAIQNTDMESTNYAIVSDILARANSAELGAKEKEAAMKIYEEANKVHEMAKRTANFYMNEAQFMLNEGQKGKWLEEDKMGYLQIVDLVAKEYGKKDDYDTPTRLFVGADHKNINERGKKIKSTLENYRDSLATMIAAKKNEKGGEDYYFEPPKGLKKKNEKDESWVNTLKESLGTVKPSDTADIIAIYKALTVPETVKNHGEDYPWQAGQFDHSPMVAAAAIFTSLKGKVLQGEKIALDNFAAQNEAPPFKFNKIEPLAFAQTGYINVGDSLPVNVMIAAYDSTVQPEIRYWLDDSTMNKDEGMNEANSNKLIINKDFGGTQGAHSIFGQIGVETKNGKQWKNFKFDYKVGSPGGSVANTELNVLYRGYANQVQASGSGYDDVSATCSGCTSWSASTLKDGSKGYVAQVGRSTNTVTINVSGKDKDGKSVQIESKTFRCLDLPPPRVFVTGVDPFASSVSRVKMASGFFGVKLFGAPIDIPFQVTGGKVTLSVQGVSKSFPFGGNKMPGAAAGLIRQLRPGSQVMIEPTVSSNGKNVKVAAISYKVL